MLYDKDIREPLAFYLEEIYGKNRILEEQVMGQSRADLVMVVHDALYGIEIKSDADSYARLDRQVKDYNLYYDYDLAVVGTRNGGGSLRWNRQGIRLIFICCGSRRVTHRWTGTVK